MSQRVVRTQQTFVIRNRAEVLVKHLLRIHYRSYLQEIEFSGAVVVDIAGKLYLYGASHALGTILH